MSLIAVNEKDKVVIYDKDRESTLPVYIVEENVISRTVSPSGFWVSQNAKFVVHGPVLKLFCAENSEEMWENKDIRVRCLKFSPDVSKIASGYDCRLTISNTNTGKVLGDMNCGGVIQCVDFFPSGTTVACGLEDGILEVWQIDMKKRLHRFRGHGGYIISCAVFPTGFTIVSVCQSEVRLWNYLTGECEKILKVPSCCENLMFSKSGTKLCICFSTYFTIWNMVEENSVCYNMESRHLIMSIDFSFDDEYLLAGKTHFPYGIRGKKYLDIWKINTRECIQTILIPTCEYPFVPISSPDGSKILLLHASGAITTLRRHFYARVGEIDLVFQPDHTFISLDQKKILFQSDIVEEGFITAIYEIAHFDEKMFFRKISGYNSPKRVRFDLKGEIVLEDTDVLRWYIFRCAIVLRILLGTPDSRFANRMKLSIWLIPDVFYDAVKHESLGMTRDIVCRIYHIFLKTTDEGIRCNAKEWVDFATGKVTLEGKPHPLYLTFTK